MIYTLVKCLLKPLLRYYSNNNFFLLQKILIMRNQNFKFIMNKILLYLFNKRRNNEQIISINDIK